jgi:hypothetical protein
MSLIPQKNLRATAKPLSFALAGLLILMGAGCATSVQSNVANTRSNPPPAERFANFTHFEMEPLSMEAPYAGQDANEAAKAKIQENLDSRMVALIEAWNRIDNRQGVVRTLHIKPMLTEIKFVNGTARFWAGAMAGSSIAVIKLEITEAESGTIIAEPEFYARAAAMSGAWSVGGADNAMLTRIANRVADYLSGNYDAAVGGLTGADVE